MLRFTPSRCPRIVGDQHRQKHHRTALTTIVPVFKVRFTAAA